MADKHWHRDIKVGDEVSYSDVNLWNHDRGTVERVSEDNQWAYVWWNKQPGRLIMEYRPNLISWR